MCRLRPGDRKRTPSGPEDQASPGKRRDPSHAEGSVQPAPGSDRDRTGTFIRFTETLGTGARPVPGQHSPHEELSLIWRHMLHYYGFTKMVGGSVVAVGPGGLPHLIRLGCFFLERRWHSRARACS